MSNGFAGSVIKQKSAYRGQADTGLLHRFAKAGRLKSGESSILSASVYFENQYNSRSCLVLIPNKEYIDCSKQYQNIK